MSRRQLSSLRTRAADPADLHPQVAADIRMLQEFEVNRDRLLDQFLGRRLGRSVIRNELLRLVALSLHDATRLRMKDLQKLCGDLARPTTIAGELYLLADLGAVVLQHAPADKRTIYVRPSKALVKFYSEQMPLLYAEVVVYFSRRRGPPA